MHKLCRSFSWDRAWFRSPIVATLYFDALEMTNRPFDDLLATYNTKLMATDVITRATATLTYVKEKKYNKLTHTIDPWFFIILP